MKSVTQGIYLTNSKQANLRSRETPLKRAAQLFITLWLLSPMTAHACAVCFGNKDSLQTKGAMAGVLFLLIVILTVLAGFAVTFIRWGMRERALQAQLGPVSSEPGHS